MGYIRDRWRDPARKGKGKRWQVKYQVDGRERDGGSYDTKAIAQRHLVELESSVQRGQWIDPNDRTTVAEYARRWAEARPHRRSTARRTDQQIRNHIEGTALGRRRLAAVLPSDVQAWVAERAPRLAPSTLAMLVNMLKAVFAAAVLDRLVASSPVVRIALPSTERARVVPLTVDQVRTLAKTVPERNRAMVLTQAGIGVRLGELIALRVQDVDFLRRVVRIEHQLEFGTRERVETKTPRSRRTVPLPTFVGEALAEHMRQWPPLRDGTIFYGHNGRPYDHTMYGTKVLTRAVRALAGAPDSDFPVQTSTHDLRHHYASVLLAGGESVVAVAERLGHDDASMVLRVYGHLMPDSEERTRQVVDKAWSAPPSVGQSPGTAGNNRDARPGGDGPTAQELPG